MKPNAQHSPSSNALENAWSQLTPRVAQWCQHDFPDLETLSKNIPDAKKADFQKQMFTALETLGKDAVSLPHFNTPLKRESAIKDEQGLLRAMVSRHKTCATLEDHGMILRWDTDSGTANLSARDTLGRTHRLASWAIGVLNEVATLEIPAADFYYLSPEQPAAPTGHAEVSLHYLDANKLSECAVSGRLAVSEQAVSSLRLGLGDSAVVSGYEIHTHAPDIEKVGNNVFAGDFENFIEESLLNDLPKALQSGAFLTQRSSDALTKHMCVRAPNFSQSLANTLNQGPSQNVLAHAITSTLNAYHQRLSNPQVFSKMEEGLKALGVRLPAEIEQPLISILRDGNRERRDERLFRALSEHGAFIPPGRVNAQKPDLTEQSPTINRAHHPQRR